MGASTYIAIFYVLNLESKHLFAAITLLFAMYQTLVCYID